MRNYFVIKVDYFKYDPTKEDGIGREPLYLHTTRDKFKVLIFDENLTADNLDLRWFETREEAQEYIDAKLQNSCCFDNPRVEEISYDLGKAW